MRILIADDHPLIVKITKLMLGELDDNVEFDEVGTVAQLRERLKMSSLPDLALVDLAMPDASGGVEHIREAVDMLAIASDAVNGHDLNGREMIGGDVRYEANSISTKISRKRAVIVLSATDNSSVIQEVLAFGAKGYIVKSSSPEVIISAVRLVICGGIYVPPEAIGIGALDTVPAINSESNGDGGRSVKQRLAKALTDRQIDVFELLAKGWQNKRIARELRISEGTVKIHLAAIFRVLHVRNRLEALLAAQAKFGADSELNRGGFSSWISESLTSE